MPKTTHSLYLRYLWLECTLIQDVSMQRRAKTIHQVTGVFLSSSDSSAQHIAINTKAMMMQQQQPQHQLWNGWKKKNKRRKSNDICDSLRIYILLLLKYKANRLLQKKKTSPLSNRCQHKKASNKFISSVPIPLKYFDSVVQLL